MLAPQLQETAQLACFSIDQKAKTQAEQTFMTFVFHLPLHDYATVMTSYTQTVLYVFSQYNSKMICQHQLTLGSSRISETLNIFLDTLSSWLQPDLRFVRRDGKPLDKHVENSLALTVGTLLKFLFRGKETQQSVVRTVKRLSHLQFQLFVWKWFIEVISQVDTSLGYINYRTMIYAFQDEVIPSIAESLIPNFLSLEENMKIGQLSNELQNNLSVAATKLNGSGGVTIKESRYTGAVFRLLQSVFCFNYNITYGEYDQESNFQNCHVAFPVMLAAKIVSKEFLDAFHYVIGRLFLLPADDYLILTLQCFKKLVLAKTSYIDKPTKHSFYLSNIAICNDILTRLLSGTVKSKIVLSLIVECSTLFMDSVDVEEFKLIIPINSYQLYLKNVSDACVAILRDAAQHREMHCNNVLLMGSTELMLKIVSEGFGTRNNRDVLVRIGAEYAVCFLDIFFKGNFSLLGSVSLLKTAQLKKMSESFYRNIKGISTVQYEVFLTALKSTAQRVFSSGAELDICNLLLLLTEIQVYTYIERNILYESSRPSDVKLWTQVVQMGLQFIEYYHSTNQSSEMVGIAILFFVERLVSDCPANIQYTDGSMRITSKGYTALQTVLKREAGKSRDQQFLVFCFKELTTSLESGNVLTIQYTFDALSSLLLKFKWALKREVFKSCQITRQMLKLCSHLSQQSLDANLLHLRVKLYSIITMLSFDDVLDSYQDNIETFITLMCGQLRQLNHTKVMYDVTGICATVETSNIYRFFLNRFDSRIGIRPFFTFLFDNCPTLEPVLELCKQFLDNKSHRLGSARNIKKIYEFLAVVLPFWNKILEDIYKNSNMIELLQIMYGIFNKLGRGSHINFALLREVAPQETRRFLQNMLISLATTTRGIEEYPQLCELHLDCSLAVARQLVDLLLRSDRELVRLMNTLLEAEMQNCKDALQELSEGSNKPKGRLEKYLDIIKHMLSAVRVSFKFKHDQTLQENLAVLSQEYTVKQSFTAELFKFGLGNGRNNLSLIKSVSIVIMHIGWIYRRYMSEVFQFLGLDQPKTKSLNLIFAQLHKDEEDEEFVRKLREWMKVCDEDYVIEFDY